MRKRILIGVCAAAAALCVVSAVFIMKMPHGEIQKHLAKNHAPLFTDAKAMDLIDTDNFDLFISGEYHAIEKNFKQQLFLIKYMHENANVNYILAESGVGSAGLMNMYLQTGDEQILKDVFAELRGTMGDTNENYEFYKELYEYNETLPEGEKLKYVGMDIEHQRKYVPKYLKYLLPQNPAPPEIAPNLEKLREFTKYEQGHIAIDFIAEIGVDIAQNEQIFRDYLGENYFDFELAVENFNDWTEIDKYNHNVDLLKWDAMREANMVDNVMRTVEHYKSSGKFYGEWGSHHTVRKRVDKDRMRLAAELDAEGSPIAGRVCSILNVYVNCQGRNTNNTTFEPKNEWSEETLLDFTKFGNGDVTLFSLLGENSPYEIDPTLNGDASGFITDKYQYVMLIENSEPCTRYREK